MCPPPSRVFHETFLLQWHKRACFSERWGATFSMCLENEVPVICLSCARSCLLIILKPSRRKNINTTIILRLVTELGDIMQLYLPILLLTLCFLSFFLLFVCLSLSLLPVAAVLLHRCPDCGLCCGGWLLLRDTTWRQVAVLFPFPQVPKSSPA